MTSGHCHNRFSLTWLYGVKERDDCVEVVVHPAHPDQHQDKNNEKEATNETKTETETETKPDAETKTKTIQLKRWSTFRCHQL